MDMSKGGRTMTQSEIVWEIEKRIFFIEDSTPNKHYLFIPSLKKYVNMLNNEGIALLKKQRNERQFNYAMGFRK